MSSSVAVLGIGIMGAGMARSLLREGHEVTVWNRNPDKAKPLADDGARVADSAADAVAAADVVITMLFDTDSVVDVMDSALDAAREGAVWLQTSTVGIEGARRLTALAEQKGVAIVDAPVIGTKAPAENGKLVILASGPSSLREKVAPVLDAVGSATQWVGEETGQGSRLKLAVNAWVGTMVNGIAQSMALTKALGLEPQAFLDAVAGQAVDAPYVQLKGKAIIDEDFTPSFELDGMIKDLDLIIAAMDDHGTDSTLARSMRDRGAAASLAGHGADDMASVWYGYRSS
ncbi:3-hydroxyisobutyrate dehydrogenase [Actinomycetospora sp. NBRC 106375]|uniref:NAD(P)-dependent oxidoreductase n=1 Tax=Actinomycetospora sp. NBRC 106375 TaxID=3032207 RepID=UPI0024A5FEB0|nr:NAD(P)-dependent oxidoreductase [Actinomycetospora sp. NBRC 106375]GLZ45794.1 3-hydroxyisobutyrate dehydrogenase [Actinomycetospora sp. NBRC 106375]